VVGISTILPDAVGRTTANRGEAQNWGGISGRPDEN